VSKTNEVRAVSDKGYCLSRHAFICFSNEYCVFLDLRSDKYLCVEQEKMDLLGNCLRGYWNASTPPSHSHPSSDSEAGELARQLVSRGLLTVAQAESKPVSPVQTQRPTSSLLQDLNGVTSTHSPIELVRFFRAGFTATRNLKHRSLEDVVKAIAQRTLGRRDAAELDLPQVRRLVGTFVSLRSYFPRSYLCLFDSLALLEFLAFYEQFPTWVFGVNGNPFAAHCWVQYDSIVLNDTVESVAGYTPIMAVGCED
jgi:hypothetical protein